MQLDQRNQASLLAKAAFRMDAKSYNATPANVKFASGPQYAQFAQSTNYGISVKLLANFKANSQTSVNEHVAVNSMLVLNKIRTVGCTYCLAHACALLSPGSHALTPESSVLASTEHYTITSVSTGMSMRKLLSSLLLHPRVPKTDHASIRHVKLCG